MSTMPDWVREAQEREATVLAEFRPMLQRSITQLDRGIVTCEEFTMQVLRQLHQATNQATS